MTSAFTVSVDVSKLQLTTPPFSYHVFVDPSQIGIVLEFMELVRYLWDLKKPVILSHNNAYIHYLEDIRILHLFKDVQIEYFTPSLNETDRMKSILHNLKFFDSSTGQTIPRIIFSRFEKKCSNGIKTGLPTTSVNTATNNNVVKKKSDCSNLSGLNITPLPMNIQLQNKNGNSKDVNLKNKAQLQKNQISLKQEVNSAAQKRNLESEKKNISTVFQSGGLKNFQDCQKSNKAEPNDASSKPANNSPSFLRKRPQNLKPFSLGPVIAQLRKNEISLKQEVNSAAQKRNLDSEKGNISTLDEKQNDLNTTNENECDQDEESSYMNGEPNKKRKRIRKHKSRKQKQDESVSAILNSSSETNPNLNSGKDSINSPSMNNSRHVRFVEVVDDEHNESEFDISSGENSEVTKEQNNEKEMEKAETNSDQIHTPETFSDEKKNNAVNQTKTHRVVLIENPLSSPNIPSNDCNYTINHEHVALKQQFEMLKCSLSQFKAKNISPIAHRSLLNSAAEVVKNPLNENK